MKRSGYAVVTLALGAWACSKTFEPEQPATAATNGATGAGGATHAASTGTGMGGAGGTMMQTELYVDAAQGMDQNAGTFDKPLKTVKEAVKRWKTGQTVILKAGTYSPASNETWGYDLPDGIVLKSNSDGVILKGPADLAFTSKGKASIEQLTFDSFKKVIDAGTGPLTFKGIAFVKDTFVLDAHGTAEVSFTDACSFEGVGRGVLAADNAKIHIADANAVDVPFDHVVEHGFLVAKTTASFDVKNLKAVGVHGVFYESSGASVATFTNVTVESPDSTDSIFNVNDTSAVTLTSSSIANPGKGTHLLRIDDTVVVVAHDLSLQGGDVGVFMAGGTFTLDAPKSNSKIQGQLQYGIEALSGAVALDIKDAWFSDSDIGISTTTTLNPCKIRGTTFVNNKTAGVEVLSDMVTPDLGLNGDPGKNTFTGNGTGVLVTSYKFAFMYAIGNTWNAFVQGSDINGKYPNSGLLSGPQSGQNFTYPSGFFLGL
jgi:hypothetical protein